MRAKSYALNVVEQRRVGHGGCYYVIVPDHAAGLPRRFTVYRVPASPSRRVRIVGRELRFNDALGIMHDRERKAKKGAGRT